jgi:transposase-like protein
MGKVDFNAFRPPAFCDRCGKQEFKEVDSDLCRARWVCAGCGKGFNYHCFKTIPVEKRD